MIDLGICGTNNSHSVAFSRLANRDDLPEEERVDGARCVAFFAYDDENVPELRELGLEQVERKEDLISMVDGVLCVTRDGTKHLDEAVPFLEAGVPTFVDKPLAVSLGDAREIADRARETGTPLMSCSSLRYAPEITSMKSDLDGIAPLRTGTVTGMGETIFYGVHTVEMMSAIFGSGVEYVFNAGSDGHDVAIAQYSDGKTVSIQVLRDAKASFRAVAYGDGGRVDMPVESHLFYPETLKRIIDFVRTGESPIALEDTVEIIAVLNALVRSAETREKVYLNQL